MSLPNSAFRLELLAPDTLARDPFPDLPLRLWVEGEFTEPVDGAVAARFPIRFGWDRLAELSEQIRVLQQFTPAECVRGAHAALRTPAIAPEQEVALLLRLREALLRST